MHHSTLAEFINILKVLVPSSIKIGAKSRHKIIKDILNSVSYLLGNTLDYHPEVLLIVRPHIESLTGWFDEFIGNNGYDDVGIVNKYLKLFKVVLGPNIP